MKSKPVLNPKKKIKEVKKIQMVQLKPENRKIKKRRKESFSTYVYKVLKQVHPQIGISSGAMLIMNSFVQDMVERIANEAANLLKKISGKTLKAKDIQAATQLLLPGELGRHAISEGFKSVKIYLNNRNEDI